VTTCSAERSLSVLRLIKSYLRSTMDNDRLHGLALLAVHQSKKLNYDAVIAEYTLVNSVLVSVLTSDYIMSESI